MAGTLNHLSHYGAPLLLLCLLSGCGEKKAGEQSLSIPERPDGQYVTDQTTAAGLHLTLRDDGGGCKLQVGNAEPQIWLKPMAPCHFIKSPGRETVQVFQQDKTTWVVAVVGTPVKKQRCGQEVQGLIIKGGEVAPSSYIMRGSVYCADQGLQNFQYSLFTRK
ncbi:MAG: hypothetical protein KJ914_08570 [Gammaproteobacteria bacterium]|nr:hypothetical protein [Gammaproteobacteria bacterium]MBU1722979.1 hypothetical protein [Gammaproteobacteria bacterium]MBU2007118.1 hypothetical protein [Gammaproteobacteria bacterium]